MHSIISLERVSYSRRRGRDCIDVLKEVSLSVQAGGSTGLMGKSGVGKSTLLNLIAGYLRPQSGLICEDGKPINSPGISRIVVFQNGGLWPWLSLEKNAALGMGLSRENLATNRLLQEMLDRLGIRDARDAYPSELSGGMQKRAELARALLARPRILMLDEALSSVDPVTKQICIDVILEYRKQSNSAVLVVSHDIDDVMRLTDRVIILSGQPATISQEIETGETFKHDPEQVRLAVLNALGYQA